MANEDNNLVLRLLREMREEIAGLRAEMWSGFSDVRQDIGRMKMDVRELGLQTALLETRMAKVLGLHCRAR
jgi:hypothetical protein